MEIKEAKASMSFDSRKETTIKYVVKTDKGTFVSIAPSGKSRVKYESRPYKKTIVHDLKFLNTIKLYNVHKIKDVEFISRKISKGIGANSLFVFQASLLKAIAAEENKELWQLFNPRAKKLPMPVGNAIGGGLHSSKDERMDEKYPEFQEFLFIPQTKTFVEAVKLNDEAYMKVKNWLRAKDKHFRGFMNDEGAWKTSLSNEEILSIMKRIADELKIRIGIDAAASSFYKNKKYHYRKAILDRQAQIYYMNSLIHSFDILYIEDPVNEEDFNGFREVGSDNHLIVGDDLTVTHIDRLKKAIKYNSINAIIIKPNQNGNIFEVKKVVDLARKHNIRIIVSHRSGETEDDTIADLAVGFKADYIKCSINGKERRIKFKRLAEIEKKIRAKH